MISLKEDQFKYRIPETLQYSVFDRIPIVEPMQNNTRIETVAMELEAREQSQTICRVKLKDFVPHRTAPVARDTNTLIRPCALRP